VDRNSCDRISAGSRFRPQTARSEIPTDVSDVIENVAFRRQRRPFIIRKREGHAVTGTVAQKVRSLHH
jgi:hypothetical protein